MADRRSVAELVVTAPRASERLPPASVALTPESLGLPPLHESQRRFLLLPHSRGLFVGGWGAGKTTVGAYWLVLEASRPENRGLTAAMMAPDTRLSTETHRARMEQMHEAFSSEHGFPLIMREDKSLGAYHLITGARILRVAYGHQAARLGGLEFCAAWVDEIDRDPNGLSNLRLIDGRVRVGTQRVRYTTTPLGYQGACKLFADAQVSDNAEIRARYGAVRSPTWDNPGITREYVKNLRYTLPPHEYRQLVKAEITRAPDGVLPEFNRDLHVTDWSPENPKEHPWILAIDWGYTHAHIMAAWVLDDVVVDGMPWPTLVVFDEKHMQEYVDERVIEEVGRLCRKIGSYPAAIYADAANQVNKKANDELISQLASRTFIKRMRGQDKQIWEGLRTVRSALAPPAGKQPRVFLHERLAGEDASEFGVYRAILDSRRKKNKEGELIDAVAENKRIEHALDCLRYLCVGQWGIMRLTSPVAAY